MATQGTFTTDAVRDGDPGALAAVCAERGAAVLAYCEQVAAPRQAALAAADAFALMRSELGAGAGTGPLDVDGVLHMATRRAAAARGINAAARPNAAESCAGAEPPLVAWLEQPADHEGREHLDEHLARCRACAAGMRRLEAAQRAFDRPPRAPLPERVVDQVITALVAAAPVKAVDGDAEAARTQALQHVRERLGRPAPPEAAPRPEPASAPSPVAPAPVAAAEGAPAAPAREAPAAQEPVVAAGTAPTDDAISQGPDASTTGPSDTARPSGDAPRRSSRSGDAPRRSSRPRRAPQRESQTLSALIAETWSLARYRVLGPRPGSAERRRQRLPVARKSSSAAGRSAPAAPANGRSAELAAVGLFAVLAITVALVTFLIASSAPQHAGTQPGQSLPAGVAGAVQPAANQSGASVRPAPARARARSAAAGAPRVRSARLHDVLQVAYIARGSWGG